MTHDGCERHADALLPVAEALARITADLPQMETESVGLDAAAGRILAEDVTAALTQPPFDSSSMDGYAVRAADVAQVPAEVTLIGESAAGHGFSGTVAAGQAVRIFTGAPVPPGADAVVMQEDTRRVGDRVVIERSVAVGENIRPRGLDFAEGRVLLAAGRKLTSRDLALAAAANRAVLPVRRRPRVAVLATGDELVPPGGNPRPDQIISSIPLGLAPLIAQAGAEPQLLGIAKDTRESLVAHIERAKEADILLTIGGASVGDHDLVQDVLTDMGMTLDFWRIAMRPGKPLLHGSLGRQRVLGVPGNPVSALVTARIFLVPMIHRMLGLPQTQEGRFTARLAAPLPANGPREHYMRATLSRDEDGSVRVTAFASQDSAQLSNLAAADVLIIRPPHAPAAEVGETVTCLPLDF